MRGEVTIDFGIDLGTTNSAIAVFDRGGSHIIKCAATGSDLTPSVVSWTSRSELVGAAAKALLADHTRSEFKRNMGTTTSWARPNGERITPEALSAIVLRSLRQDAIDHAQQDITAAVITVPAAFDTAQIAATRNAGEMAGFAYVETLQEPIAAALAYGLDQTDEGLFLVFDLGGGTFDAAILSCQSGVFSVLNHRGDNDLGGGRWDSAIVDSILLPKLLSAGYKIESARDRQSKLSAVLKVPAENARIELSRKEVAAFMLEGISDEEGRPLPGDVTLSLSEFEPLIEDNIRWCVETCRELLEDGGVPASAVSRVILVGGPTRTPAVRRAVQALGIELATMVDPMTVVARGAAVYAASRTRPVSLVSAPSGSAVFQLVYDAMVERDRDEAEVGLKLEDTPAGTEASGVRIVAADGSWDSGLVTLEDGAAIVSVKLIAPGTSTFKITAYNAAGGPVAVVPETFSVTRAVAAAPAPVNHSIGVGVDEALGGAGRSFSPVVAKGATMPIFERKTYRTTRSVSPREPDADPIHLLFLEGESVTPERNLKVGEIVIRSDAITRPLPANSEVEVVFRWEQGFDPKVSAYIPFLDQQFDSVLTMQNKQMPDIGALEEEVAAIRERLGDTVSSSDVRAKQIHEIEVRLIDARRGDAAAAHGAAAQIGPLLDAIEAESSSELMDIEVSRLDAVEEWAREIATKFGTAEDQMALETLIKEGRGALASGGHRDVSQRTDRIVVHTWRVIFRQPGFWIEEFANLAAKAANSTDPVRAGSLIQKGRAALDRQDVDELTNVVRDLWRLFPDSSNAQQSYGIRAVSQ